MYILHSNDFDLDYVHVYKSEKSELYSDSTKEEKTTKKVWNVPVSYIFMTSSACKVEDLIIKILFLHSRMRSFLYQWIFYTYTCGFT